MSQLENITQTYTSFSGADMVAVCNILGEDVVLGTLQTISYSLHMERNAVRSIGNINAKDYTQGPRTIAGSLVFAVFDKHVLYHMAEAFKYNNKYKDNKYTQLYGKYKSFTNNRHVLADELPPFNVTITFANEYGNRSKLAIYGIRLLNEGQVMSVSDLYTENTYQFVALDIDYLYSGDPQLNHEEEDEVEEQKTPHINTSKNYKSEDSIVIEHINHDYTNSLSLINISKKSLDESAKLNGGVLYIKQSLLSDAQWREYSIPKNNTSTYRETLRLENGIYNAYFVESETDLKSNEITINIHDKARAFKPIIENTIYCNGQLNLKFKLFSALYLGHTKLNLRDSSKNKIKSYSIDENYNVLIPFSDLKNGQKYYLDTSRTNKDYSTFETYTSSHIFELNFSLETFDIIQFIKNNWIKEYESELLMTLKEFYNKQSTFFYSACMTMIALSQSYADNDKFYYTFLTRILNLENTYLQMINGENFLSPDAIDANEIYYLSCLGTAYKSKKDSTVSDLNQLVEFGEEPKLYNVPSVTNTKQSYAYYYCMINRNTNDLSAIMGGIRRYE